jgi:hypothetical protein
MYTYQNPILSLLMIFGIKNENTKSVIAKKNLSDINPPQLPEAHTSFSVPKRKVKTKRPGITPMPVAKK